MAHVMYLINDIVQLAVMIFFISNFLDSKYKFITIEILMFIPTTIVYLVGALNIEFGLSSVIFTILRNLPIVAVVLFAYEGGIWKKIKAYIAVYLFIMIGSIIGTPIMLMLFQKKIDEMQVANFQQNMGMMVWSDTALIIALLVSLFLNRKDDFYKKNRRTITSLICFPLIHLVFMCAYMSYVRERLDVQTVFIHLVYQSIMISLIIIQFYALKRSHELLKAEEMMEQIQSEIQHTYQYCMLADEKFHEISKLRHDVNNQVQAIKHLIFAEQNEEAEKLLDQLHNKLENLQNGHLCNNPVLNAVLMPKSYEANNEGIETEIILNDCDNLPFEQYDLCSLFSNLFDNAIEACKKMGDNEHKFIEIKSKNSGCYFVVKIVNSCEEIVDTKKTFSLTKRKKGHGYGMQIIKSIVSKYNGDLNIESENGKFSVTVALKLKESE